MVVRWSSSTEECGQNEKRQNQGRVSRRVMQILDNLNMRISLLEFGVRWWKKHPAKS
jgi:hypothetical protein